MCSVILGVVMPDSGSKPTEARAPNLIHQNVDIVACSCGTVSMVIYLLGYLLLSFGP